MRSFLAIACAASLVAACGDSSETYETEDGSVSVTDDGDGNVDIAAKNADGSTSSINVKDNAGDMPSGWKLPGQTRIVSSAEFNDGKFDGAMINMESDLSSLELADAFRRQSISNGVELSTDVRTNEDFMIGGATALGGDFTFQSAGDGDGSTGVLVVKQPVE